MAGGRPLWSTRLQCSVLSFWCAFSFTGVLLASLTCPAFVDDVDAATIRTLCAETSAPRGSLLCGSGCPLRGTGALWSILLGRSDSHCVVGVIASSARSAQLEPVLHILISCHPTLLLFLSQYTVNSLPLKVCFLLYYNRCVALYSIYAYIPMSAEYEVVGSIPGGNTTHMCLRRHISAHAKL